MPLKGRTVFAILYYIQIRLFYLFFIHALCNGDHDNIPKQAQEVGQMFSHDWNRIVQAMDATENKTDGKIPGTATWGLDTYDDRNDRLILDGVNFPACRGLGGGPRMGYLGNYLGWKE